MLRVHLSGYKISGADIIDDSVMVPMKTEYMMAWDRSVAEEFLGSE